MFNKLASIFKSPEVEKKENLRANSIEVGDAWNFKMGGVFYDEYNTELQGLAGITKYEEMRSGDSTIAAVLLAMELPIRATDWKIEPGTTNGEVTEKDQEIADFVNKALFDKMEVSFDDYLRQALTMLPFGHSVFEKVYKIEDGSIVIKKLAARLQKSIYEWQQENGEPGITQMLNNDKKETSVSIPSEKLVIFSYRKEGNNPEGRSVLRPAYKNWYYKDNFYSFEGVKHERLSVWIPIITLPKGAGTKDKAEAETILQNLRSTEQSYIVLPSEDWKFEFADLKNNSTSDPSKAIMHHNREIVKGVLAQFLDLWQDKGSYSLSKDQTSLFMLSLGALANQFKDVTNKQVIEELVNYNFVIWENQTYPKLNYSKLGAIDFEEISEAIVTVTKEGIVTVDDELEDYVRKILDLPKKIRKEGAEREKPEAKKIEVKKEKETSKEENKKTEEKEKLEATISEASNIFAEKTNIKPEVANKIIKLLVTKNEEGKDVSVIDIGMIISDLIWKLKREVDIIALLNKASDKKIEEVIDDLVKRRNPDAEYPRRLEAENYSDMEELKESKKIFNYLDILNVQNKDK